MLGRDRILLEPRLAGALVVGPAAGGASLLPGTLIPWSRILLTRQPPTPCITGPNGRPVRAAWARPSLHPLALRAADRTLRRELAAGTLRRTLTAPGTLAERIVVGVVLLLTALALTDVVLTFLGHGLLISLPPAPTLADRLFATVVPGVYFVLLAVSAGILLPLARARRGTLTVTAEGLMLAEPSGVETMWRWADLAELRASAVLTIHPRGRPAVLISMPPGGSPLLGTVIAHCFPDQTRRDARALRRTLVRAGILWALGCAAAAGLGLALGIGPAVAIKALAACFLIPALGALKVYGEPALQKLLARTSERRARRTIRQGRVLARAAGRGSPPA